MLFELSIDYLLGLAAWLLMLAMGLAWLLALRRRSRMFRQSRLKWVDLGLSMWVFLASCTVAELYFAIVYDQSDSLNATNVSKHWFERHVKPYSRILRFRDDTFATYRDVKDFPKSLKEGQHHICFIGDSFTFGHGIKDPVDRFSNRVGFDLERIRPGHFVVSNISEVARNLFWVELVLQELIADDCPVDTVVYVMCLNDIEAFEDLQKVVIREESGRESYSFPVRNTYFLNLAYFRLREALHPGRREYFAHIKEAFDTPSAWEGHCWKLESVQRQCAEAGIELRLVIFPLVHNLGPDYPFREVHERIAVHCRAIDMPVLDLLPALEPHAKEGLTVNPFDAHPNERAHELAAEAIERDLLGDLID